MRAIILAAIFALLGVAPAAALDNGLARTPPMGWNSWNKFACNVSEKLIREQADAMVASGMRDAGYRYVVIDDCWQVDRTADGTIQADPNRFPSGMKALADYVHARGLKFGLYSDAGDKTCQGRPGSHGHEAQDAQTYAAWGVDYLKYDWCSSQGLDAPTAYKTMRDALAATHRPILFSICEWGTSHPTSWAPAVGNVWRTTGDIIGAFDQKGFSGPPVGPDGKIQLPPGAPPGMTPPSGAAGSGPPPMPPPGRALPAMGLGVLQVLDSQAGLSRYAGAGGWNDPDMLEVGNGGMTSDEDRAQFALWAILGAPLIAGNDLRNMSAETRAILTNREIIAVSQDSLGQAGDRIARNGDADIWGRPLAGGGMAVALLNRSKVPLKITLDKNTLKLGRGPLALRDLWQGVELGRLGDARTFQVAPHSALILRVTPRI